MECIAANRQLESLLVALTVCTHWNCSMHTHALLARQCAEVCMSHVDLTRVSLHAGRKLFFYSLIIEFLGLMLFSLFGNSVTPEFAPAGNGELECLSCFLSEYQSGTLVVHADAGSVWAAYAERVYSMKCSLFLSLQASC